MITTIFITTPSFNARSTIDATIASIAGQAGDFSIRYHIQDGGSDDGTVERLELWQRRFATGSYPLLCRGLEFSFDSTSDAGMYDALCTGFAAMDIAAHNFMTWINADDVLMPGALALAARIEQQFRPEQVSWFSGAATVIRDDVIISSNDRPVPTAVLKAGICDGTHWDFLQQEGTFFRKWLWTAAKPDETVRPMKLAGDWNLWRVMAQKASLVQARFPLGGFRIGENQLSVLQRGAYMAEIDTLVAPEIRRQGLADLADTGDIKRRFLRSRYGDGQLSVIEEIRNRHYSFQFQKVFQAAPQIDITRAAQVAVVQGLVDAPATEAARADASHMRREGNIVVFDRDWQFPAVTEQHAYHQMRDQGSIPDGTTYVAFPWANLIDKLQTRAADTNDHLRAFRQFCETLPTDTHLVTVCQHILMKRFLYLFRECGISTIFWTHATHEDVASQDNGDVALHPFPLYPVQVTEKQAEPPERPYLYSFIGAKSNQYYLTRAREWIIDKLADHPRSLIIGRDGWHYNKVVYEHQIRKTGDGTAARDADKDTGKDTVKDQAKAAELVDQSASDQFRASLMQSIFSLCPSGSGPNSIRLWESLGAGAVPVILADTWAPPGNPALWEAAVVFCEETEEAIAALPARLAKIAADPARLAAMRHAMDQLWMLYGPQSFIYDVARFMLERLGPSGVGGLRTQSDFLPRLLETLQKSEVITRPDALLLLRTVSGALLTQNPGPILAQCAAAPLAPYLDLARDLLPGGHPAVIHFDNVHNFVARNPQDKADETTGAPVILTGVGPAICLLGRHANRTPLAYGPFRRLAEAKLGFVQNPDHADLVMTGFNLDLKENAATLAAVRDRHPRLKIAVISEEPLWDSVWSDGFAERNRVGRYDGDIELPYSFLNHQNSSIFEFRTIPYFLLTSEDFATRYGLWIARYAKATPEDMLSLWSSAPVGAAFFAEVRDTAAYAKRFDKDDVHGLSVYRTEIAQKTDLPGVMRVGKGWGEAGPRQALPDWHLDKLTTLDGRVRVISTYENTHQQSYISEKIFDAFVTGGIPTYYASPRHRILDLVPETAMLNTFGQSADQAARRIESFAPTRDFAVSWLETAAALRARFSDTGAILDERRRVVNEILKELKALV